MDFFVRDYEPAWQAARNRLGDFVGTRPENLIFAENATAAMNTVANSFPLHHQDEVLLTDHEYGAVLRIWQRACQSAAAKEPQIAHLPGQIESADQVVEAIFRQATERTRLLVVSHITSPTAIILPIQQICTEARRRDICVCVDGPHAPAQIPLALGELPCDFYTASLHKWVSRLRLGIPFRRARPAAFGQNAVAKLGKAGPRETNDLVGGVCLVGHSRSVGVFCVDGGNGLA